MTLSRADYHSRRGDGSLRTYLATAKSSIEIVSISMEVTQKEGSLIELFAEKLNNNDKFMVRVTLLSPDSTTIGSLSKALDLKETDLKDEIGRFLSQLCACKNKLSSQAASRLFIYTHYVHPIGSAILLDASENGGIIQVETKLYKAPRTESFGFEVVGPTPFYNRNYKAWQRVFADLTEWLCALSPNLLPASPKN